MPRIKLTPTVKIALWMLRIYLLVLITLIAIKFGRVLAASNNTQAPPQNQSANH